MKRLVAVIIAMVLLLVGNVAVRASDQSRAVTITAEYRAPAKIGLGKATIITQRGQGQLDFGNDSKPIPAALFGYFNSGESVPAFLIAFTAADDGNVGIYFISRDGQNFFVLGDRMVSSKDGPAIDMQRVFAGALPPRNMLFSSQSAFGQKFIAWLRSLGVQSAEAVIPNLAWNSSGHVVVWYDYNGYGRAIVMSLPAVP